MYKFTALTALALVATQAQATAPIGFAHSIESQIDQTLRLPVAADSVHGTATLAVVVDANGAVNSVALVKSAGFKAFDAEAVRTAKTVRYPATGSTRTVAMVLGFNEKASVEAQVKGRDLVTAYCSDQRKLLAGGAGSQPVG